MNLWHPFIHGCPTLVLIVVVAIINVVLLSGHTGAQVADRV